MAKEMLLALAVLGGHTPAPTTEHPRVAATCFSTGEETDGFNKICYYDCLGDRAAITIKSTQLCPLTINR
jgi:hypothetical protein